MVYIVRNTFFLQKQPEILWRYIMQVPLLDLVPQYKALKSEFMKVMEEVCDSQRFILGDKVVEFEKAAAAYCQTNDSIGVTSGSDALIIALMEANIGAGDEVITSTFTFFATAGAIARVGAKPVFCDIDPVTGIEPETDIIQQSLLAVTFANVLKIYHKNLL